MRGLTLPLVTTPNRVYGEEWDGKTYKLASDLEYRTRCGIIHTVPKGFITDYASCLKRIGKFIEAAVVHDYLYSIKAGRKYSDGIFKEMMERAGCPRWRINMMYRGVRMFGWWSYYTPRGKHNG